MPNCKECFDTFNIGVDHGDNLCAKCHQAVVDQEKKREQEGLPSKVRENIDAIVKSMIGNKTPRCVTLVHWGVVKKSGGFSKKIPGLITGAALGGIGGEMIFGGTLLSKEGAEYSGELGVLVVTSTHVLITHTTVPFHSEAAEAEPEHTQLLRQAYENQMITQKTFEIAHSQIIAPSANTLAITSKYESLTVIGTKMFIKGQRYELPLILEVQKETDKLGSRISPAKFAQKLLADETLFSDKQVEPASQDAPYMEDVFHTIMTHKERGELVKKFPKIPYLLRTVLEKKLRTKGSTYQTTLVLLIVSGALTPVGIVTTVFADGFSKFLFMLGTITALITIIVQIVNLRRSIWCRKMAKEHPLMFRT